MPIPTRAPGKMGANLGRGGGKLRGLYPDQRLGPESSRQVGARLPVSPPSPCRYTCPFVEKFSIEIETYYRPDAGKQNNVFNLSAVERRQRILGECSKTGRPLPFLCYGGCCGTCWCCHAEYLGQVRWVRLVRDLW